MLRPLWKHQAKDTLGPLRGSITPNVFQNFRSVRLGLPVIKKERWCFNQGSLGCPSFQRAPRYEQLRPSRPSLLMRRAVYLILKYDRCLETMTRGVIHSSEAFAGLNLDSFIQLFHLCPEIT